jgi:hypothetical protein
MNQEPDSRKPTRRRKPINFAQHLLNKKQIETLLTNLEAFHNLNPEDKKTVSDFITIPAGNQPTEEIWSSHIKWTVQWYTALKHYEQSEDYEIAQRIYALLANDREEFKQYLIDNQRQSEDDDLSLDLIHYHCRTTVWPEEKVQDEISQRTKKQYPGIGSGGFYPNNHTSDK